MSLPFNSSHHKIRDIVRKHWHILSCDPHLEKVLPKQPQITYRRPPTFKNILAPSRLRQHNTQQAICDKEKGSFRCQRSRCLCCNEISDRKKTFKSTRTKEEFSIKFHMTCQTAYVIYIIECPCGLQYVGRTIQKLHLRVNKHRANIQNKFMLHGLSRHCSIDHPSALKPFKITPIYQCLYRIDLNNLRKGRYTGYINSKPYNQWA